jgi:hypothetical protein
MILLNPSLNQLREPLQLRGSALNLIAPAIYASIRETCIFLENPPPASSNG